MRNRMLWMMSVWLLCCGVGLSVLWAYSNKPSELGAAAMHWPANEQVPLDADRPTLVVYAHPRCPCTRATFSQLERLQAKRAGAFATRIIFYEPSDADDDWRQTYLWRQTQRMVDTKVYADPGGRLIHQVGSRTSGMVALYNPDRTLKFAGGITPSRGHEGPNLGMDAVIQHLDGEASLNITRVFGCPLLSPEELCGDAPSACATTEINRDQ